MSDGAIVDTILTHFPKAQAVYLFGSYGSEYQRPDSDVDLALLLPPQFEPARFLLRECAAALENVVHREVDLIDLRKVNTVLQNEIVNTGRILRVLDKNAVDEFEMLVWSLYQKLNEERAGILEQVASTGRVYEV